MSSLAPALNAPTTEKFEVERHVSGQVTLLTMHGTLDNTFDGTKLAGMARTKKVVLNLRDVRRFASWGMSEWMELMRLTADSDVYLVECSTYAMSQVNLVTGLIGHAKLVSFYASFRCGSCNEEIETLFLIPRDRDLIGGLPGSQRECATCSGKAYLEEYPAAFFDMIVARPTFDIDDDVLAFFRSRFSYDLAPDLARFRAHRKVDGSSTYLRLSGSLTRLQPEALASAVRGTTVVDLDNIVFDPAELTPWSTFVRSAMPTVKSLQLMNCPVGFLERGVDIRDLRDKLRIRTFKLPYDCLQCETTAGYTVDVAENLEQLVQGTAPQTHCKICKSVLVALLTPDQITVLRGLPARDRDPGLERVLAKAAGEPVDKLENCLALPQRSPDAPTSGSNRWLLVLGVLVVAALGVMAWQLSRQRVEIQEPVVQPPTPPDAPEQPAFNRPEWILTDAPASAYCHDAINRLICIGVSPYLPRREDAVVQATDAALEELVHTIGLKISTPAFKSHVLGHFDNRAKTLAALQAADLDRKGEAYAKARDAVASGRKRVAEALKTSGGPAVPSQRTDWYWEEYAGEKERPNETLVFVRYDISLDAIKSLIEHYSATVDSPVGGTAITAFPLLAWESERFVSGVVLDKPSRRFARAGVTPAHIITAVAGERVHDVATFVKRLAALPKAIDVTILDAGTERAISVR